MGGPPKSPNPETQSTPETATTELAPLELEVLARASAVGTTEMAPVEDDRVTVEMVSLVAIVDDELPHPDPTKLARGSDAVPPRQARPTTGLRRRRESLRVEQIAKPDRDDD